MPVINDLLSTTHPDYKASREEWERNERRFTAGESARQELDPFQWEKKTDDSYLERRAKAVCPPLMQQAAEKFVGTLFEAPAAPDFGGLGEIREERGGPGGSQPTRAEIVYDYADGAGTDARGWDAFWSAEMERATATGHRWIMCEAPAVPPATLADEIAGRRPYLVGFSPLAVPDWHYDGGILQYARLVTRERIPKVEGDRFTAEPVERHLLMVRAGYEGLGEEYSGGGWWLYDEKGEPVTRIVDGEPEQVSGTWERTDGEIPLWRLYYDRQGRGLSDLGAAQVAIMNLLSALYNDAIEGGGRALYVTGVNVAQFNDLAESVKSGSKLRPIPAAEGTKPVLYDTAAATASGAIMAAMERTKEIAEEVIMRELATSPDASGRARQIEFLQGASPRLASMALHLEEAQNIAIRFLQLRWGIARPTGGVTWPKRYDLRSALEKAQSVLSLLEGSGASSPTLVAAVVRQQAEREGLAGQDADLDRVEQEVRESLGLPVEIQRGTLERDREFRSLFENGTAVPGTSGGDGV